MEKYYRVSSDYFDEPLKFREVYLVQLGRIFCGANTECADHLHKGWYELTVVTDGKGTVGAGSIDLPVEAGDIFLSLPFELHRIWSSKEAPLKYDFLTLYSEEPQLAEALRRVSKANNEPQARLFTDKRLRRMISDAVSSMDNKDLPLGDIYMSNLLENVLIALVEALGGAAEADSLPEADDCELLSYKIISYIDSHIFELKSLGELAEAMSYNYSYLSAYFKRTTGRTLSEHFRSAKLSAARQLLSESNMRLAEIAEQLGYSSIYVFSRAYKRLYGESPSRTRGRRKL